MTITAKLQQPAQTTDRSTNWKLFHSINYLIGGFSYFVGSALLFPFFADYPLAAAISGWVYTIGSLTFLIADITQWLHYVQSDCRFLTYVINFFINVIGSFLYLLGSICFIPQLHKTDLGLNLFITASFFIMVAQVWKLYRTFNQSAKPFSENFQQNKTGILVDIYAGLGALMYFTGSFLFKTPNASNNIVNLSALIFTLGGTFFILSGAFIQERYFWEYSPNKQLIKEEDIHC